MLDRLTSRWRSLWCDDPTHKPIELESTQTWMTKQRFGTELDTVSDEAFAKYLKRINEYYGKKED